jgi:hypothetical protein
VEDFRAHLIRLLPLICSSFVFASCGVSVAVSNQSLCVAYILDLRLSMVNRHVGHADGARGGAADSNPLCDIESWWHARSL